MWFGFWMIQYQNLLFIRIKCQTITAWPTARLFIQKFSLYNCEKYCIVKNIASLVTILVLPAWSPQIYVDKAITRIILIVLSLYQISRKYMIYSWQCKSYISQLYDTDHGVDVMWVSFCAGICKYIEKHYSDVIITVISIFCSTACSGYTKESIKVSRNWPLRGNQPMTSGFTS